MFTRKNEAEIQNAATEYREKHGLVGPEVDILSHVEKTMKIDIFPFDNLMSNYNVDTMFAVSGDVKSDKKFTIFVDKALYYSEARFKRLRFSIAHELGHLVLHSEVTKTAIGVDRSNIDAYHEFLNSIPVFIEKEADEFAGAFLVPENDLYEAALDLFSFIPTSMGEVRDIVSKSLGELSDMFVTSNQVISIRLERHGIYSKLKKAFGITSWFN